MKKHVLLTVICLIILAVTPAFAVYKQPVVQTTVKDIIEVDGYQFRDLNDNGVLDPYEDWRLPIDERIADLLSQMTIEEKVGLMFHINTSNTFTPPYPYTEENLEVDKVYVLENHITHYLDNNNGTPDYLANLHNTLQGVAESSRLGIPMTFSSDRAYNAWGGMIDMPHAAFGAANDLVLAARLFDKFAEEMAAVGYHLTLHPSAVELFRTSWGENHEWVAALTDAYVKAFVGNGVQACLKHFVTNEYAGRVSPAGLLENTMAPWRAGIAAGSDWIMMSARPGLGRTNVQAHMDKPTMDYLRNELGFEGVILTDWFPVTTRFTGVTVDGIDTAQMELRERYKFLLELGVDQFGGAVVAGTELTGGMTDNFPEVIINLVKDGEVSEARIDESATRILRSKFKLGLFENPYVDPQRALEIAGSLEYAAEPFDVVDMASLERARNPRTVALDKELQAASTILLINDGILPLAEGTAVYVPNNPNLAQEVALYGRVVDDLSMADAAVMRITPGRQGFSSEHLEMISYVLEQNVPMIVAIDSSSVADYSWFTRQEGISALMLMTYQGTIDHGSPLPGFSVTADPEVFVATLFGRREPTGKLFNELPRSQAQVSEQWGDVPFDLGATTADRIRIAAAINRGEPVPTNLGDPLFMYGYGMRYGLKPKFEYSMLVAPREVKAGEPFLVSFLLENKGWDGCTTVEVLHGDEVIGSKFVAVNGGLYRVVDVEVALKEIGAATISVAGLTAQIEVIE